MELQDDIIVEVIEEDSVIHVSISEDLFDYLGKFIFRSMIGINILTHKSESYFKHDVLCLFSRDSDVEMLSDLNDLPLKAEQIRNALNELKDKFHEQYF